MPIISRAEYEQRLQQPRSGGGRIISREEYEQASPEAPLPKEEAFLADVPRSLARGAAYSGPADVVGTVEWLADKALGVGGTINDLLAGRSDEQGLSDLVAPEPERVKPDMAGAARAALGEAHPSLVPAPAGAAGRIAEAPGRALAWTAASAPLLAAGGPALLPVTQAARWAEAAGALSPAAGQTAREAGAPEWVATPLEMALPVGVGMWANKARGAAKTAVESVRRTSGTRAADQAILEAGQHVQERLGAGAGGTMRPGTRRELIGALDETVGAFPAGDAPTPAQVAGGYDISAPALKEELDRVRALNPNVTQEVAERYNAARRAARQAAEGLEGRQGAEGLPAAFSEQAGVARREARGLYEAIPVESRPRASAQRVGEGMLDVATDIDDVALRRAGTRLIEGEPGQILDDIVEQFPTDKVPVGQLEGVASSLKQVLRDAPGSQEARAASTMLDIVEGEIERSWKTGSVPTGRARRAYRRMKQAYDARKPKPEFATPTSRAAYAAQQALNKSQNAAGGIIRPTAGARPLDVARRARIALRDDPVGMERLRSSFIDEALKEGQASATAVSKAISRRAYRETYTHLFGSEAYQTLRDFSTMERVVNWGAIGSMGETLQTKSGQLTHMVGDLVMDAVTGQPGAGRVKRAWNTISRANITAGDARKLYDEAWTNPELMSAILKAGTMRPNEWKKHITTVLARTSAAGGGGQ